MPARSPQDLSPLFEEAFNSGNLNAFAELYEAGAVLEPQPGQLLRGIDQICEGLKGFIVLKGKFDLQTKKVVESGDLALLHSEWSLSGGTAPDGSAVSLSGRSTEVARRQSDGTWRYVFDLPFDA